MTFRKITTLLICVTSLGLLSACSETRYAAHVVKQIPFPGESKSVGSFKVGSSYKVKGRRYKPTETYEYVETGVASWYGPGFHGKKTANGEIFDKNELTAAHKTLQLPSIVKVTNLSNGRSAILRVNDRGPFANDRILDVSERAATILGFKHDGTAKIRLEVLGNASKQVASLAKKGHDTRGFEVALNQNKNNYPSSPYVKPRTKPAPITQVALSLPDGGTPRPLLKPLPVQAEPLTTTMRTQASNPYAGKTISRSNVSNLATGKIYVQAGSFSLEKNALSLSNQLSSYGSSKVYMTRVNNRPYFRVRLGPYENRGQASEILTALNQSGNKNAMIVVD